MENVISMRKLLPVLEKKAMDLLNGNKKDRKKAVYYGLMWGRINNIVNKSVDV